MEVSGVLDAPHLFQQVGPQPDPLGVVGGELVRRLHEPQLVDRGLERVADVGADRAPLVDVLERGRDGRDPGPVLRADRIRPREELVRALLVVSATGGQDQAGAEQARRIAHRARSSRFLCPTHALYF